MRSDEESAALNSMVLGTADAIKGWSEDLRRGAISSEQAAGNIEMSLRHLVDQSLELKRKNSGALGEDDFSEVLPAEYTLYPDRVVLTRYEEDDSGQKYLQSHISLTNPELEKLILRFFGIKAPDASDFENMHVLFSALNIAHQRNQRYKDSWKQAGWRGAVFDIRKKAERLFRQFFSSSVIPSNIPAGESIEDDAYDLINFAVFFLRARFDQNEWGVWL